MIIDKKMPASIKIAGDCEVIYLMRLQQSKMRLRLAAIAVDPKPPEEEDNENNGDFEENEAKTGQELTIRPENATVSRHCSATTAELTQPATGTPCVLATTPMEKTMSADTPVPPTRRPTADDLRAASRGGRTDIKDNPGAVGGAAMPAGSEGYDEFEPRHQCHRLACFMAGAFIALGLASFIWLVAPDYQDGYEAATAEYAEDAAPPAVEPGMAQPAEDLGGTETLGYVPPPAETAPAPAPTAPAAMEPWICDRPEVQVEWNGSYETGWVLTCGATSWACPPGKDNYTAADCTQLK